MTTDKISVIIPIRNEKRYVMGCLDSIINGTISHERLEVLVADGMSDDGTREEIMKASEQYPIIKLLDNKDKTTPYAMNLGIRHSTGNIIVRMDAHAIYPRDYIEKLVASLKAFSADNIGGIIVTEPSGNNAEAKAVAAILSHPFGVGNSRFRVGSSKPEEVDTVPFGCYRRDIFNRIGLYDELFTRGQDDELNARLRRHGGRIILVPDIKITYFARDRLVKMAKMLYQYGYFKPLVNIKIGALATWRQLAPPIFTASILLTGVLGFYFDEFRFLFWTIFALYASADLLVSAAIARRKGASTFPFLFAGFFIGHMSYGIGYFGGIFDFYILKKQKLASRDLDLSR